MTNGQAAAIICSTAVLITIASVWLKNRIEDQTVNITRKLDHMAAVQIEQEDLDAFAEKLDALTDAVTTIDTSKLQPAEQAKLQNALSALTQAVNEKLPVTVEAGDEAVETVPDDSVDETE